MKKILMAAVMLGLAGVASAAESSDLGGVKAAEMKALASAEEVAAPAALSALSAGKGVQPVNVSGKLYKYNSATRKYDIALNRKCSVTAEKFRRYLDAAHSTPPMEVVAADYYLTGFIGEAEYYPSGTATGPAPTAYFNSVLMSEYFEDGLASGVKVSFEFNNAASAQEFLSKPVTINKVYVSYENSGSAYFNGEGVKWGYLCDTRGVKLPALPAPMAAESEQMDAVLERNIRLSRLSSDELKVIARGLREQEQMSSPYDAYTRGVEEASDYIAISVAGMEQALAARDGAALRLEVSRMFPMIERLRLLAAAGEGANYGCWAGKDIKRLAEAFALCLPAIHADAAFLRR